MENYPIVTKVKLNMQVLRPLHNNSAVQYVPTCSMLMIVMLDDKFSTLALLLHLNFFRVQSIVLLV